MDNIRNLRIYKSLNECGKTECLCLWVQRTAQQACLYFLI